MGGGSGGGDVPGGPSGAVAGSGGGGGSVTGAGGGGVSVVFHFSGGKVKYGGMHGKEKHTLFPLIYHHPLCTTSTSNHS